MKPDNSLLCLQEATTEPDPNKFSPHPQPYLYNIQNVPGGKVSILGGHSISHSAQKVYMYMRSIPNSFQDRAILLYSSKTVDKKYYILFLIPVLIVQVTKLVQCT
jgi:hypothetical protein